MGSTETTKVEILQALTTIACASVGGRLLYQILVEHDWFQLIKEIPAEPLATMILFRIFQTLDGLRPDLRRAVARNMPEQLDSVLCKVLKQVGPTPLLAKDILDGLYGLFRTIHYRSPFDGANKCGDDNMVRWMTALAELMGTAVRDRRSIHSGIQGSVVGLARLLVGRIPQFKVILFAPSKVSASGGSTPLSFIFTTTLLIDIRSTIPSITEIQEKPGYLETSTRLANSYDLVFLYLDSLLGTDDADEGEYEDSSSKDASGDPPIRLQYDLLLKLQEDITQTMHLTVEFLRDRYDAAANDDAKLLHMASDTLVVSQIGALGFWLHDEDTASADNLLEVLLRLCLCETPYRRLYAKTAEVMVRDRPDLQQKAKALAEDENGLGKAGRGGGDFSPAEVDDEYNDDDDVFWGG